MILWPNVSKKLLTDTPLHWRFGREYGFRCDGSSHHVFYAI